MASPGDFSSADPSKGAPDGGGPAAPLLLSVSPDACPVARLLCSNELVTNTINIFLSSCEWHRFYVLNNTKFAEFSYQCGSLNKFKRYDVLVSNDMTKLWGNPAQKLAKRIIYKYIHKVVTRTKLLSVLKPSILSMFWITNVFYWPGNLLNNNY